MTQCFDLANDIERKEFVEIGAESILIVEGVFLFRPELLPYLDVRVFIDVSFGTVISRAVVRDLAVFGSKTSIERRYRQKYIPGQQIYLKEVNPGNVADVVIQNDDHLNPKVTLR